MCIFIDINFIKNRLQEVPVYKSGSELVGNSDLLTGFVYMQTLNTAIKLFKILRIQVERYMYERPVVTL